MIQHKNSEPWTDEENARCERMREEIGCVCCRLERNKERNVEDFHHIISGNARMGHWYTLPLCKWHHAGMHNGSYSHDEQIDIWLKVQRALKLDDSLPKSKTLPRRIAC